MVNQRQNVEYQNRLVTSNCPVNKLANETLSDIFLILIQDESLELWDSVHRRFHNPVQKYPWIIAAVCQRWRMICLGKSRLWSSFDFWINHDLCGEDIPGFGAHIIHQTSLQLERSRNAPLFVQIEAQNCMCNTQTARFDVLLSQAQRWVVLTYDGTDEESSTIPWWIPDGTRFPNLRALCLTLWDFDFNYSENSTISSLRSFAMIGILWQNLTYLRLTYSGDDYRTLMELLSQCQNVTSLHLQLSQAPRGNFATAASMDKTCIIFPQATEVSLASYETHIAFDYFQIPAVKTLLLTIDLNPLRASRSLGQIAMDLITRSRCSSSLQELQLDLNGNVTPHENESITELLKLCSNLRIFSFAASDFRHDATTVIQSLAPSAAPPDTWLCPRLQVLRLELLRMDPQTLIGFVDAIVKLQDRVGVQRLRNVVWVQPGYEKKQHLFKDAKKVLKDKYNGSLLNLEIV